MQAVLISALTAALVTLLIEYAAKPHLEARKDRIVETHRSRRELISRIYFLSQNFPPIAGVGTVIQEESGVEVVNEFLDHSTEIYADLLRYYSSLSKRQQAGARILLGKLHAALRITRRLLNDYESSQPEEVSFKKFADEEIGNMVRSAVGDALRMRSILLVSRWRPWRYYKVTRQMARIPLSLPEPSRDVSPDKEVDGRKSEQ